MQHKLVTEKSFTRGKDAYCETCLNPDYGPEDGWTGVEGVFGATDEEVTEWYDEHVRLSA